MNENDSHNREHQIPVQENSSPLHSTHNSHSFRLTPHHLEALLFTTVIFGVCLYYFLRDPAQSEGVGLHCPTHYLTSLHCPACGSQRAFHALLHGSIGEAISFNILAVFIFFPAIAYVMLAYLLRLLTIAQWSALPMHRVVLLPLIIAALLFTIARNLPFAPFNWLAP